jgi:hypothetical protein
VRQGDQSAKCLIPVAHRLIRLRDGAITDDIAIASGRPAEEAIRQVSQLG